GGAIHGASTFKMDSTTNDSCTFTGNVATSGGALRFTNGSTQVTLQYAVISNNTATSANGGGFEYTVNGRLFLFNSTVNNNVAAVSHRDIYRATTRGTLIGTNTRFGQIDTAVTPIATGTNQYGSDASPIDPGLFPVSNYKAGPNGVMTMGLHYTSNALSKGY